MTPVPPSSYWRSSCAYFGSRFWIHQCTPAGHWYFDSLYCSTGSRSCQHLGVFELESCFGLGGFGNLRSLPFFCQIAFLLLWYQCLYFLEWSHVSYSFDLRCSDCWSPTSQKAERLCHTAACGSLLLHSSWSNDLHRYSLTILNHVIGWCLFSEHL